MLDSVVGPASALGASTPASTSAPFPVRRDLLEQKLSDLSRVTHQFGFDLLSAAGRRRHNVLLDGTSCLLRSYGLSHGFIEYFRDVPGRLTIIVRRRQIEG